MATTESTGPGRLLIDGEWRDALSGKSFETTNPADESESSSSTWSHPDGSTVKISASFRISSPFLGPLRTTLTECGFRASLMPTPNGPVLVVSEPEPG